MEGKKIEFDKVFRALGDKLRLRILDMLMDGEMNAGELLEQVEVVQSTLSHHMKSLCDSGMVIPRKEGKWTYYSVSKETVARARQFLTRYQGEGFAAEPDLPEESKENQETDTAPEVFENRIIEKEPKRGGQAEVSEEKAQKGRKTSAGAEQELGLEIWAASETKGKSLYPNMEDAGKKGKNDRKKAGKKKESGKKQAVKSTETDRKKETGKGPEADKKKQKKENKKDDKKGGKKKNARKQK